MTLKEARENIIELLDKVNCEKYRQSLIIAESCINYTMVGQCLSKELETK